MNVTACAEELAIMGPATAPAIERVIRKYINEGLRNADAVLTNTAAHRYASLRTSIMSTTDDMYRILLVADMVRALELSGAADLNAAGTVLNTPRKGSGFALESDELYRPRLIVAARAL